MDVLHMNNYTEDGLVSFENFKLFNFYSYIIDDMFIESGKQCLTQSQILSISLKPSPLVNSIHLSSFFPFSILRHGLKIVFTFTKTYINHSP